MDLAQILMEEVWRIELVNNYSRLLLVASSHRNITSISKILVQSRLVYWKAPKGVRLVYCKPRGDLTTATISIRLVFKASSGLVVFPTTVLHIQQRWELAEHSGLAIDESCNNRVLTVCTTIHEMLMQSRLRSVIETVFLKKYRIE